MDSDLFMTIYLSSIAVFGAIAAVMGGISKAQKKEPFYIIMPILIVGVGCPFFIPLGIAVSPFVGLYYFGKWVADKV